MAVDTTVDVAGLTDRQGQDQAPLQVVTAPLPGDVHLTVYVAPDAPLGQIDLTLSAGRGSRGRGHRTLDNTAVFVRTLHRMAQHIAHYAAAYENAAREDEEGRA